MKKTHQKPNLGIIFPHYLPEIETHLEAVVRCPQHNFHTTYQRLKQELAEQYELENEISTLPTRD